MQKNSIYKAARISKLAAAIRAEEAPGHKDGCACPVCQATAFVQRSMLFLEGAIKAKKEHGQLQA